MPQDTIRKRNIVDFIETASKNPAVGKAFLEELNKEDMKAEDLRNYLHDLGYEGIDLEDCKTLVRIVKDRGAIKAGDLERAY